MVYQRLISAIDLHDVSSSLRWRESSKPDWEKSMNIAHSVTELIGRTPLLQLGPIASMVRPPIVAKLESRNPANSVKDRIGLAMIEAAEREGALVPGESVIEYVTRRIRLGVEKPVRRSAS